MSFHKFQIKISQVPIYYLHLLRGYLVLLKKSRMNTCNLRYTWIKSLINTGISMAQWVKTRKINWLKQTHNLNKGNCTQSQACCYLASWVWVPYVTNQKTKMYSSCLFSCCIIILWLSPVNSISIEEPQKKVKLLALGIFKVKVKT